jgi:predicted DNA-binding protein
MLQNKFLRIRLPSKLRARLRKENERTGAPIAEILRRAADAYLKERENAK